jgi:hypothetical protein
MPKVQDRCKKCVNNGKCPLQNASPKIFEILFGDECPQFKEANNKLKAEVKKHGDCANCQKSITCPLRVRFGHNPVLLEKVCPGTVPMSASKAPAPIKPRNTLKRRVNLKKVELSSSYVVIDEIHLSDDSGKDN